MILQRITSRLCFCSSAINFRTGIRLCSTLNNPRTSRFTKMEEEQPINPFYVLSNDSPIVKLDCDEAFKGLTDRQKLYAHYIAKASFYGAMATYAQVSYESLGIFVLLHRIFSTETMSSLESKAKDIGFTDDEFKAFLMYAVGFFANNGNYKGFGDSKFIPNLPKSKFRALVEKSEAAQQKDIGPDDIAVLSVYEMVEEFIYAVNKRLASLGFNDVHVTTYHSPLITKADCDLIDRYMKSKRMEAYNTRLLKNNEGGWTTYIILVASSKAGELMPTEEFEGCSVEVRAGDYRPAMARVTAALAKAALYADNDTQKQMIEKYIASFTTGQLNDHKDGSRLWIRDIGPAVESYIGFIENYRDPAGVRGEWEGFAAAVNKETSRVFQELVKQAEELLKRLPWGEAFEKDKFLKPDFTALDVIAFAGSGIPSGINIPNYDEIRQEEGFKNVTLSNVISAIPKQRITFLNSEDEALYLKYFKESFNVQVGLHELLGHGSGKLFTCEGGKFNFDRDNVKDLVSGGQIQSWYEEGESWSSVFGEHSNAYEECRAEAVGYYLSCFDDILKIFGHEGQEAQDVKYVNWLNEARAGLCGLEFYNPEKDLWGQAHSRARYECVGEDGQPDLLFTLDKSKIETVGKPAMAKFLKELQFFKSTADATRGIAFFKKWDRVEGTELRWRRIVLSRRTPRRFFLQSNTIVHEDGSVPRVELKNYPSDAAGFIQSVCDRYDESDVLTAVDVWRHNVVSMM
ncbi:hypothetical protein QR680_000982 [Steinernema hermaphroditum]|uniref:Dipeptidyl peptidase 3 n=1 Tax=Steinernema hermaphroditum TaxID=289476 RepID=A0AA39LEL9_9BILA|nr:hypothetical protein QR680_000982 [Steinernema hermaphroditum]